MRQQGNKEDLPRAYYLINTSLVAFMIVYDIELFTLGKPKESEQAIRVHAQKISRTGTREYKYREEIKTR